MSPCPCLQATRAQRRRPFLFGAIHLGLIYAMGYFLIAGAAPGRRAGRLCARLSAAHWWGVAAAFAAVPLESSGTCCCWSAVKRMCIGRIEPGTYPLESTHYLRYWFLSYLLSNTRMLLLPVYATVYLPPLLRLLGARSAAAPRSRPSRT